MHYRRPGYPSPAVAEASPAAIVERRKAPGLLLHPCPSPRSDPGPMAVAIGLPVDGNPTWIPYWAIVGGVVPTAIAAEVFRPDGRRVYIVALIGLSVLVRVVAA